MRVRVVVNRFATAFDPRAAPQLIGELSSAADVEVVETACRGNGIDLGRRALRDGVDVVIAYGGDGTVNEVINGVLTDGPGAHVPRVGLIPAGSTNVFVRALGLPNTPPEAAARLRTALVAGSERAVSLGRADDQYFCFAAGLGFDAAIVHAVDEQRRLGKKSTHALYARMGVRAFFASERRVPPLRVELPDGASLSDVFFAIVTNCDPWTFVGPLPLHPTPNTSFDTGLGLYARRRMNTAGVLFSMAAMLGPSRHVGARGATLAEDLDRLTVLADMPLPFQIDGDAIDHRAKVVFRSVPRAVRIAL